jgi:hypothetical protein
MADLTEFSLPEAIADLARTPATCAVARVAQHLRAPQRKKDTWSTFDIVGHLIYGERTDWMPQVRIMLKRGHLIPLTALRS